MTKKIVIKKTDIKKDVRPNWHEASHYYKYDNNDSDYDYNDSDDER